MSNPDTANRMKKGQGIVDGFKVVGGGFVGDDTHPEMTGEDPMKRGPGRPPKNEDSFRQVGPTAEEEQGKTE